MNIAVMRGALSSAPSRRTLPSGACVVSLEMMTEGVDGGRASVPVAWYDPPSEVDLAPGDAVVVVGSVRRRFFRVGAVTQSRTEVVAEVVLAAGDRRRVRLALQRCAERIGDEPGHAVRSRK